MVRITTRARRDGRRETHDVGGSIDSVKAAIKDAEGGMVSFGRKWWHVLLRVDEIVSVELAPSPVKSLPTKQELLRAAQEDQRRRERETQRTTAHRVACAGGTEVVVRCEITGERTTLSFALPLETVFEALVMAPSGVVCLGDGLAPARTIRVGWVEGVRPIP